MAGEGKYFDHNERLPQIQIKILNNTIDLDYPCYTCVDSTDGHGYGHDEPREIIRFKKGHGKDVKCEHCDDKRFVLTEAGGEAIMALVRRHI